MLFIALFLCGAVLLAVNHGFRQGQSSARMLLPLTAFAFFIGFCLNFLVLYQFLILTPIVIAARGGGWRPSRFLGASLAATTFVLGCGLVAAISQHMEEEQVRNENFFMTMEGRIPRPRISVGTNGLSADARKQLEEQEQSLYDSGRGSGLKRLHEEHWEAFINSPGFGQTRGFRRGSEYYNAKPFPPELVPQPGGSFARTLHVGPFKRHPGDSELASLLNLHASSYTKFVNPFGFGYVKDREHVAGFQSHGFRELPNEVGWQVQRVDLVGMLIPAEPLVYLTDGLPRMDQLTAAQTRPLDAFEEQGLRALRNGEHLYARESSAGVRLMGALRAVNQCLKCHDCQRGDLLGAFTYCLGRK